MIADCWGSQFCQVGLRVRLQVLNVWRSFCQERGVSDPQAHEEVENILAAVHVLITCILIHVDKLINHSFMLFYWISWKWIQGITSIINWFQNKEYLLVING